MVMGLVVSASAADRFIDNNHWKEVSAREIDQKYRNKESFIVMFFRWKCDNSKMRRKIVEGWMNAYNIDICGVDVDADADGDGDRDGIPNWVFDAINADVVVMPVICVVDGGVPDVFSGRESMQSANRRVQTHLGVHDNIETDFSKLNREVFGKYSNNEAIARQKYLMSEDEIPGVIANEAKNAVKGKTSEREKLKAIYDWITGNIYYNYGMLDGSVQRKTTALQTYQGKSSVCEGYANLTLAMCNAVGIPCRIVDGFAAGIGSEGVFENVWEIYNRYLQDGNLEALKSSMKNYSNHAWNEAYVDGKWIILDTTWGSGNEYYPPDDAIKGDPVEDYFDPDFHWLSESHMFWTEYDDNIEEPVEFKIGDVNNDNQVNSVDKAILNRYLAGWEGYKAKILNWDAADINKDTTVNSVDKAILNRYLAGWEGYDKYFN